MNDSVLVTHGISLLREVQRIQERVSSGVWGKPEPEKVLLLEAGASRLVLERAGRARSLGPEPGELER